MHKKLYIDFIEALDANDNGISAYDPADTKTIHKRFNDGGVTLGSLVSDLNYDFNPEANAPAPNKKQHPAEIQSEEDTRFLAASALMGTTFLRKLDYCTQQWLPARSVVLEAYKNRTTHDPSGRIMVFEAGGVPWKDHLYTFEADPSISTGPKTLFVLYPEGPHEGAKWRVQAVSVTKDSFESRCPLKEEWRGVRDEKLSEVTGVEGCVFVHASGFIGGNLTKSGALDMARISMEGYVEK